MKYTLCFYLYIVIWILLSILAESVEGETWSFTGRRHLDRVPQEQFERQVRYGMATIERYFNKEMREVSSGGQIKVTVKRGPNSYYDRTAWYERGTICFGLRVAEGPGPDYTDIQADFIRRTILHELFHHYIPSINYHNWQSQLRGNRCVDIGDLWHTLTEYDCRQLTNRAGFTWRSSKRPWDAEEYKWWIPVVYSWTNPKNPVDVNDDGLITPLDALKVINALQRRIEFNENVKPAFYYDVNADKKISSLDALKVINAL